MSQLGDRIWFTYPGFLKKALTFSFDDGTEQDIEFIRILNKNKLKATFNLHYAHTQLLKKLPREEILAIYNEEDGHEIANHSYTHLFLNQLPAGAAAWEIIEGRKVLEETFSRIVRGFAYPFGTVVCSPQVVQTVRDCGVAYARTTHSTGSFALPDDWMMLNPTCHFEDKNLFELAERFLGETVNWAPHMFYLWGHSFEFDKDGGWEKIEKFCEMMAGRDDIWYATNIEICDYVNACRRIQASVKRDRFYNPTNTTLYLQIEDERFTIAPGETLVP